MSKLFLFGFYRITNLLWSETSKCSQNHKMKHFLHPVSPRIYKGLALYMRGDTGCKKYYEFVSRSTKFWSWEISCTRYHHAYIRALPSICVAIPGARNILNDGWCSNYFSLISIETHLLRSESSKYSQNLKMRNFLHPVSPRI